MRLYALGQLCAHYFLKIMAQAIMFSVYGLPLVTFKPFELCTQQLRKQVIQQVRIGLRGVCSQRCAVAVARIRS